jgi:membrane protease subunit HflK
VFGGMDKIILDSGQTGSGVVPFLPLNEMTRRTAPPVAPQIQSTPTPMGGTR